MDPLTAIGIWGVSLLGLAALVRAAGTAAALPKHERHELEDDPR